MEFSIHHRLKISRIIIIAIIGGTLGVIYVALVDGFKPIFPIYNGLISGILMGSLIGVLELYIFQPYLKNSKFLVLLFIRIATYMVAITLIILIVVTVSRGKREGMDFFEALISQESKEYIIHGDFLAAELYTFVVSIIVNFGLLVSIKMGRGVLINYLLGNYYHPQEVYRIFCFIQIENASVLLRNSNLETYHNFLNEIISDITFAIINTKGYIYEYMDNQIVLYWKPDKKWEKSFLECVNDIYYILKGKEENYQIKYGLIPHLKFGLHEGTVIQGEIGEIKAEIVFQGDIMNTTARILEKSLDKKYEILVSEPVSNRLKNLKLIDMKYIGPIPLKGKENKMNIYSIGS